jgi:YadA-like membrane anchor domain
MNITKAQISAVLVAMAALSGTAYAAIPQSANVSTSFAQTQADLSGLSIGTLPGGIQTVVNNLSGYLTFEQGKNSGLVATEQNAAIAVTNKQSAIDAKVVQINDLIVANPLDPQIVVEQASLATLQGDLVTLQSAQVTAANNVTNSDTKIALYTQAINNPVAAAQAAAAAAATNITAARNQFAAGADTANSDYAATGSAGLQNVVDVISNVSAGDQTPVTTAITNADTTFQGIGANNATLADIQALVGVINVQLPNLPAISQADKDSALVSVLNGSYERAAILTNTTAITSGATALATEVSDRAALIHQEANGVHIGANSLITNEVGGVQQLFAQDAGANPINIDVTNGSDLLVNGVSVATDADVTAEANARIAADNAEAATRAAADTAETNARVAADTVLQTNITTEATTRAAADTAETNARVAADTVLQTNITTEVNRATAAEGVLQTNINTEAATRAAADTAETNARIAADTAEATTRAAADTVLQTNINTEAATRAAADTAETNARVAADTVLQTNINTEAATRAAADTAETNARSAADTVLQTNINNEAATRAAADTVLQTNINTEATTRAAADTVLQTNINTETAARIAGDNTERTRALAAEGVLGGRVTTLENQVANVYQNLKVIRKGVAMSAALQTPVINQGDKSAVSISGAVFDGEEGLSLGYARRINANTTVSASVATGFPEVLARGGLNYSF